MHADLAIPISLLYGFALTLIRVASVFVFIPIPGSQSGPAPARIFLSLACTFALSGKWPSVDFPLTPAFMIAVVLSEAVLGLLAGLTVGFISDAVTAGAQALSLPAGYAYASTFDPNTNADSGILVIFAQLMAGMLFFAFGLDRHIIRAFSASLEAWPPGSFTPTGPMAVELIRLSTTIFSFALRLALPVLGLLLLTDLAMGIVGRLNPNMQIVSLAFPIKMLIALLLLCSMLTIIPRVYEGQSRQMLDGMYRFLLRR